MELCSSSLRPPLGVLCLFSTVGWFGCYKVMIVKCDFLETSLFVKSVTQHILTLVQGLDHCSWGMPREPTSMLIKPFSGINFHVSFVGCNYIYIYIFIYLYVLYVIYTLIIPMLFAFHIKQKQQHTTRCCFLKPKMSFCRPLPEVQVRSRSGSPNFGRLERPI